MKILLDTHVFIWSTFRQNLSETATTAFLDTNNRLYLSAASYWEICIKLNLGKLALADNWKQGIDYEMKANSIIWLPIDKGHCQEMANLPFHHSDPFDRLLVAQALCEGMTLLTADKQIQQYTVSTIW